MAVPIEGFTVVAQLERIQHLLDEEKLVALNATSLSDKHIWRCSFMAESDAVHLIKQFDALGANVSQGPDSDVVLVNEFDRSIDPYCEWLETAKWEKAVIGWRAGTRPDTVSTREGWDPKVGSGLTFHDASSMKHIEFLRLEGNIEVYLNKKTGQEVYMHRSSTLVDALFSTATEVIKKYFVNSGQPPLSGTAASDVSDALAKLEKVLAEEPDWWNAWWFYGKAQMILGRYEDAYTSFHQAYKYENSVEAILRELGGACLETGRFKEAVSVSEHAVSLEPDNAMLLGNLSVSLILAGRFEEARKAIDIARKYDPADQINTNVEMVLAEIESGRRNAPRSLSELSRPAKIKKRKRFIFF